MAESGSSVYDYSPAQAVMSRLYDLRLEALISRRYHGLKLDQTSRRIAFAEIIAALSSSAAVASLAAMGWGPGVWLYGTLALAAACSSVYRTAFRLTERADRHAASAYSSTAKEAWRRTEAGRLSLMPPAQTNPPSSRSPGLAHGR